METLLMGVLEMANGDGGKGLSFWGMVGAILVALIIFSFL